ncbi:hypothetical protein [Hafnia alvei]
MQMLGGRQGGGAPMGVGQAQGNQFSGGLLPAARPQSAPAAQPQSNEPPMDFDDDIPF